MFNLNLNTPAYQSQINAQQAFISDLTSKVFEAAQKVTQLNLQLAQDMLEDLSTTHHQLLQAQGLAGLASAATSQAHPIAERLRNYQQNLTGVVAGANAELTRTAESHLPDLSRASSDVAEEVVKRASEEIDKASQRSREVVDKLDESARRGVEAISQGAKQAQGQPRSQPRPPGANAGQGQSPRPS